MNSYAIEGGKKLKGTISINPSKNSAVALLIASLLNEGKTTFKNVPRIEEVFRIIEVLESLGAKISWRGRALEIIPPEKIKIKNINIKAASKTRSIVLFIGSILNKMEKFSLPMAGGCNLGRRSLMPHVYALEEFGAKIEKTDDSIKVNSENIKAPKDPIILYESGDTVTENAIMAASLVPEKTIIKFSSANYQVQDLCMFLKLLGVKIEGVGTTTLTVRGVENIKKDVEYWITEDPVESMLFLAIAAITKSSLILKRCPLEFLELELLKLKKMGFKFKILRKYRAKNGLNYLADIRTFPSELEAPVEKIYGRPFPGLNIDNLPFFVPIATQAKGETLIHDWVYENRAIYYTELSRLGAQIRLADPHRVFITGPTELTGATIISPPALRPSAIILAAMLGAKGRSILKNTYSIERGYEDLCGRLKKLGARITKLTEDK